MRGWVLLLCLVGGCALFQSKAVQAEGSYSGELLACTAASKTLAESKACECQVKTKWGISCS